VLDDIGAESFELSVNIGVCEALSDNSKVNKVSEDNSVRLDSNDESKVSEYEWDSKPLDSVIETEALGDSILVVDNKADESILASVSIELTVVNLATKES
jgi:hypothetical protein